MKKGSFLVLALALVLGLQSLSFAGKPAPQAPDISGSWLFDVIGGEKGGLLIEFDTAEPDPVSGIIDGSFRGYGFTMGGGVVTIDGGAECLENCASYSLDTKGKMTGTYFTPEGSRTFTGKVDKKATKISLMSTEGFNLKGTRAPADPPTIPESWDVSGKGQGGTVVVFDTFTMTPPDFLAEPPVLFYTVTGAGSINDNESPITIQGRFFLTAKYIAYGEYEATTNEGVETGVFTGKINMSSNKFVFKLLSDLGDKGTMNGEAK